MKTTRRVHDVTHSGTDTPGRDISADDVLCHAAFLARKLVNDISEATAEEFLTEAAIRVVLKLDNGHESDVDVYRLTECWVGYLDGRVIGDPEWN